MKSLYRLLNYDAKKKYREMYIVRYSQVMRDMDRRPPREDILDEMADMYLAGLLSEPDAVTLFAWDAETLRKRDRAEESIDASSGSSEKQRELYKAMRYWARQAQQYTEIVSDGATMRAYRDAGVKKVRWNTERDGKVCDECGALDGEIFPIDKAPKKTHWRCRCYYTPVFEKDEKKK